MKRMLAVRALAAVAVLGGVATRGWGDVVVAPNANVGTLGNGQTMSPLHNQGAGYGRYQQVYSSALFGGFGATESITGIAFRAKQAAFGSFISGTVSVSDIVITASTTQQNDATGLDANLDNNVGTGVTTVYSGALTMTANSPGSTLIDYVINFQTPFVYSKGSGNLLLDFVIPATATVTTPGSIGFSQLDTVTDGFPSADGISSAFSTDPTQPVGSNSTTGLVTKFVGTAVPEPVSLGVWGVGLALAGLQRRR